MPIKTKCGSCGQQYQVGDNMAGKRVKCKHCGAVFAIPTSLSDQLGGDFGPLDVDFASPDASRAGTRTGSVAGGTRAGGARSGHSTVGRRVVVAPPQPTVPEPSDDPFAAVPDESSVPEASGNPALTFPGYEKVAAALPLVLAVVCLAWIFLYSTANGDAAHGWVGVTRAVTYILVYAGVLFPLALAGVHAAGKKAYFGMPPGHAWKTFGLFTLPAALGTILSLSGGSLMMGLVGLAFGLLTAMAAFVFVFSLRPQQVGRATAYVAGYTAVGGAAAVAVLVGVNILMMGVLSVGKTAHEYRQSPLGPAFAWHPPVPPESKPTHPVTPGDDGVPLTTISTTNPTEAPTDGATTKPVETKVDPSKAPEHRIVTRGDDPVVTPPSADPNTRPAPPQPGTSIVEKMSSPTVVAPQPSDGAGDAKPSAPSTSAEGTPPPPATTTSPLLAGPPVPVPGDAEDVAFPSFAGAQSLLVVRTRGTLGDQLSLIAGPKWDESASVTLAHKSEERVTYYLGPKGDRIARLVEFPRMRVEMRPITANATNDEKQVRYADVDVTGGGTPKLFGFLPNGNIGVVLDQGQSSRFEIYDAQSGQRSRFLSLQGIAEAGYRIAVTPDGHFLATVRHSRAIVNSGAGATEAGNFLVLQDLGGSQFFRAIPLAEVPPDKPVTLSGVCFTPKAERAAILYQEGGNALVETYKLPEGTKVAVNIFPGGGVTQNVPDYRGSALEYLGDGASLLVNGRYVLDGETLKEIGDLGIPDVKGHYVIDKETLLLLTKTGDGDAAKLHVNVVKLNADKLASLETPKPGARGATPKVKP